MNSNLSSKHKVGVVGAGSFGMTLSYLLAQNQPTMVYARRSERVQELKEKAEYKGKALPKDLVFTSDPEEVASQCELIFLVVPSQSFREMLQSFSPFLTPAHKLIHATKGLDLDLASPIDWKNLPPLRREQARTMSELILQETGVIRVGVLSGPNLAGEIIQGQPAATVIASRFDEVIKEGQNALRGGRFRVHGSKHLIGAELAGVFKNVMAIAGGVVAGLGYGDNTKGMLITHGLAEMIHIGQTLGIEISPFLGLAGIGDLITTCYSPSSRNFTVGFRLAKGEKLDDILSDMEEVAEGVKTVAVVRALGKAYRFSSPITQTLYRILFEDQSIEKGFTTLMEIPYSQDVAFI